MNKKIFVDTGAWFAIADKTDQFHRKARDYIKRIVENRNNLITSNLVVHEAAMLLSRKLSKEAASRFLQTIYNDDDVEVIHCNEAVEKEAYSIFHHYAEQDFSIVDCVSFVLMKKLEIKRVFTFDKHFKTMRFVVEP
jgi:predicted nucleic acid-binding protein